MSSFDLVMVFGLPLLAVLTGYGVGALRRRAHCQKYFGVQQ